MGKLQQKYIKDFVCLASNCPDTCCKGWQIYIDEKTGKDYLNDSGEIGKIARESMRGKPYSYHLALSNKRCPYLTYDNLCKVIQKKGENALSVVCSSHPRFTHILYEDEFSFLSLSCPFVANMFVSSLKDGGVEYEKIDMENPYLSQFYDTVCEESVNLGQKLTKICDNDKQLSSLCSSLFSSLEYLEEETKQNLIAFDFGKIDKDYISNSILFANLFKYFALVFYNEKSPVLPVAFIFALGTIYLCSQFSSPEKGIYKFVKETEHSTKNIRQAIRILRSPKAKNIIEKTPIFDLIY